jgi:transposase
MTDINITTAQHYIKKYNDEEEKCLPVGGSKKFRAGRTGKLTDEYSKILVEALNRHLAQTCRVTYIENAREVARNKKF